MNDKSAGLFADSAGSLLYPTTLLMKLSDVFAEQRRLGPTYGSLRSLIPLRTPSGPQWAESALEAELIEQLHFARGVYDILTQPVIRYTASGERRYTPDIVVELHSGGDDYPRRILIEVKRRAALEADRHKYEMRFAAARACATELNGVFRVVCEDVIRTPYLSNARLLSRNLGLDPEEPAFSHILNTLSDGPTTVSRLLACLEVLGVPEPEGREAIECAAANFYIYFDRTAEWSDDSIVSEPEPAVVFEEDPIIKAVRLSDFG